MKKTHQLAKRIGVIILAALVSFTTVALSSSNEVYAKGGGGSYPGGGYNPGGSHVKTYNHIDVRINNAVIVEEQIVKLDGAVVSTSKNTIQATVTGVSSAVVNYANGTSATITGFSKKSGYGTENEFRARLSGKQLIKRGFSSIVLNVTLKDADNKVYNVYMTVAESDSVCPDKSGVDFNINASNETVIEQNSNVLTYHENAGENRTAEVKTMDDSVIVANAEAFEFENEGYEFCGWATSADGVVAYVADDTYSFSGSVKTGDLYAVWKALPTATPTPVPTEAVTEMKVTYYVLNPGLEIPEETKSHTTDNYSYGISGTLNANFDKSQSVVGAENVAQYLPENVPGADAFTFKDGSKAPAGSTVEWYVIKHENDGWHVDGILRIPATPTPEPTVAPTETPAPTVAPTETPAPTAAPTATPAPTAAPVVVIDEPDVPLAAGVGDVAEGEVLGASRTVATPEATEVETEGEVLGARRAAQTADTHHTFAWFATLACAVVTFTGYVGLRKKKNEEE